MKVGIICICYNNLSGLQATLKSVMDQTRAPDEVVIIDGDSTDGTQEWIREAALPEYVKFTSAPDGGIYDALNKGVLASHSDLIMFTNSGDLLAASDTLSYIVEDYARRAWEWAYGDALLVAPGGKVTGKHRLRVLRKLAFLVGAQSVPSQALVVTRSLFAAAGPFRTDIGNSADQEHVARLWQRSKPRYMRRDIALFDTTGVSSADGPGEFARLRRDHRLLQGRPLLRSVRADSVITEAVAKYKRTRTRLKLALLSSSER